MRDSQREKVYNAEQGLFEADGLTKDAAEKLVRKMYAYGKTKINTPYNNSPSVTFKKLPARAGLYIPYNHSIVLNSQHLAVILVAHEVAHSLTRYYEGHGPEFIYAYLILVKKFKKDAYVQLVNNFNTFNVETVNVKGKAVKVRKKLIEETVNV